MGFNFSDAPDVSMSSDTIPDGTLVFAVINYRGLVNSKPPSTSRYHDIELTVDVDQPYQRRKLWDKIADPFFEGNSEEWRTMARSSIKRILEAAFGAGPQNMAAYNLEDMAQLHGKRVGIRIGIEKGSGGFGDKNRVEYLTPNPTSQGNKGWTKLIAGVHSMNPSPAGRPASAVQPAQSGFAFGQAPVTASQPSLATQPSQPAVASVTAGTAQPSSAAPMVDGGNGWLQQANRIG